MLVQGHWQTAVVTAAQRWLQQLQWMCHGICAYVQMCRRRMDFVLVPRGPSAEMWWWQRVTTRCGMWTEVVCVSESLIMPHEIGVLVALCVVGGPLWKGEGPQDLCVDHPRKPT